jgi:hypothetical protein
MKKKKVYNTKGTHLGQGVHGVKIVSGQVRNCMVLGELAEIPDSLVDVLLLHQISRDSTRIYQARIVPKLGKTMLQGLNSTLYKERLELNTRQSASFTSL